MLYQVIVNYDRSVENAIEAGKYDQIDGDITSKHFPEEHSGITEVGIELMHFDRIMFSHEMIARISNNKKRLRPASLRELLALGEKFSDLQREFPIAALGSVYKASPIAVPLLVYPGFKYVDNYKSPILCGDKSKRRLALDFTSGRWGGIYYRFAAVRND